MKVKIPLAILCVFFASYIRGQTQRLVFHHITSNQGLSQNHGMYIFKDRKGFMWFGTDDGLNKYDGKKISIYKHNPQDSSTLSNGLIRAICEDKDSNLWVGTREGLDLYNKDKDNFTRVTVDPRYPKLIIHAILKDRNQNLWIGSDNGLYVFNEKSKKFDCALADAPSTCLYEDDQGNLWIGTRGWGMYRRDRQKKFKNYKQDRIGAIAGDHKGNLWVCTWGNGLCLFDRKKDAFTKVYRHDPQRAESIGSDILYSIWIDRKHNIWVGAENGGLNLFDAEKGTFQRYVHDIRDENSITNNSVSAIYEDPIGTIWVGVHRGGINYFNPGLEKFQVYRQEPCNTGLSHNNTKSFCEDKNGKIWIGTDGGGLNVFDPRQNTFTSFTHDPEDPGSLSSNVVLAVCEDAQGDIWIGTYLEGLDKYDRKTNKFSHYKHDPADKTSLSHNNVWNIFEDSRGRLWVGTREGGLNLLDRKSGKFTRYVSEPDNKKSISDDLISAIYEDSNKNLWIGTEDGLNLFNSAKNGFTRFYSKPGSLSHNFVLSLFEDHAGNLWVGTLNGLNLFDPRTGACKAFNVENGFPNNAIQAIVEDDHSNLWISTLEGICKFNYKATTVRNYQPTDGLQGHEFIQNAAVKTRDGRMIFGGINGFNVFYPDSVRDNVYIPPVFITGFQLFDKPAAFGKDAPLKVHISEAKEITLAYDQSVFSFEFAALSYTSPEKNQYAYKMEGFDDGWLYAGTQNSATYTNLDPGEYLFRVKASNNDGIWNEQGFSIRVSIPPPWWLTWWFKVLTALFVAAAIFLFISVRTNRIKMQKVKLDVQVKERTEEVNKQKEELMRQAENMKAMNHELYRQKGSLQALNTALQQQKEEIMEKREEAEAARREAEQANYAKSIFLATMSHEIRTPMNGVIGMASLMSETSLTAEQREYNEIILNSGETLLGVINDILDFSKIESGKMDLEVKDFDLRTCIEEVLDLFASKAAAIGLDLIYQMDNDIPNQIVGDNLRLRQILLNLVGNAIKFTQQGEIFVGVHLLGRSDKQLELKFEIRDTGIGIPEDKLNRLFKAFSQVDASITRKYGGTGLGLAITEKLIGLMHGRIWVESTPGEGSTFFFTIQTQRSEKPVKTYVHYNTAGIKGKKVLVVDDNPTNLLILKNQLELWKLDAAMASSGEHALEMLSQSQRFDLVITDMQMPEMSGLQLTKSIRELYPGLPVILLSSIGDERNKEYPTLFASILSKPVKQDMLYRSILSGLSKESASLPEEKSKQKLNKDFAVKYPLHILIAEDNPINQKLSTRVLSKLGYQADVASNGKEAIDAFMNKKYDLILMDVQMPEMDGLEATKKIRTLSGKQPLIIAMTANAMQGDREMCLNAGMDDYISKPVNLDELVSTLEKRAQDFLK
jgi:signal transduction histidine kinase/CheY-like chemotaxis protein/ligand-binding sensor domain-containing protein